MIDPPSHEDTTIITRTFSGPLTRPERRANAPNACAIRLNNQTIQLVPELGVQADPLRGLSTHPK